MKQAYLQLEIQFNPENYESIYNKLYLAGISAILEEKGIIKFYLPEHNFPLAEKIKKELIEAGIKANTIHISKFDDKDWNNEWGITIEPVYIKDKIIIYPSWKKNKLKDAQDKVLIEIDPKMSFGTGHNETTKLILEMMCDYIDECDKYMLDFGCGTGILAIAAVKLGIDKAIAIDIDDDSIENAKGYFETNQVSDSITLHKSDITEISETGFDVITANITSGVIIPRLGNIYNKIKSNGKLFITGILAHEIEELADNLTKYNFMLKEIRTKAEWAGLYSIKK